MEVFTSTRARYGLGIATFLLLLTAATIAVIRLRVAPDLKQLESVVVNNRVDAIGVEITRKMTQIQSQSRAISQSAVLLGNPDVDRLLPGILDQYGDPHVFGGGIWPLPFQREANKERDSTFYARGDDSRFALNTHWNTSEALKYWEQPWHVAGQVAPQGQCIWAAAYQDDASPQPRTNCAMAIYRNGKLWGVSTIDLTLGFFNTLVAKAEEHIGGQILVLEGDGTIVSNSSLFKQDIVLKNVSTLGSQLPMAEAIDKLLHRLTSDREFESSYRSGGKDYTLFIQPIKDSPWYVATALPTTTLTASSERILHRLAMVQLPFAVILLLVMLYGIDLLMRQFALLKTNIDELSSGEADLTRRLAQGRGIEFNAIVDSFNRFIARLQGMLLEVQQSAIAIATASRQISGGNLDLSARTEEQAASLEETAASMEQLSITVRQNADHARHANGIAGQVAALTARNDENARHVMQTMQDIRDSSYHVAEITAMMDGIAFQTNLLSLNASVEAARAGNHGRGFAVVANEVRLLAQRSGAASKDIHRLIDESSERIEAGAGAVQEVGDLIAELQTRVSHMATSMSEIVTASEEQSMGIDQINHAVSQLDAMTQQNAALVEEATAAAKALQEQAGQLEHMVSGFKLA
ncbi:methyl-accepting chemotaxis protein [Dyella sp. GSA-30]|uniref:methyl-accepting chemotaxis protein n=1 Tax=Dyella sp. GSA-30 TaxID=2994496 RepID=UPI00249100AA|nr:methyl-accepting chemotaxis protein [Dyella sp. GSA-30]BDU21451.1 methyl-accepting chemotaxis protein [Dyella sp. GSA-30]